MEYSRLIDNEMLVSKLGFGGGPLSGEDWGPFNKKQNMMAVSRAYELGVNVFDTADVYGLGVSEQLLSKALGHNRHNVIISTKFGVNWGERPANGLAKTFYDSSAKRVVEALEASLKRLRLDCIPLYYIHWPDPNTSFIETAEALKRCQESGKIKNIGLSNFSLPQIKEIRQDLNVIAIQAQYSLINKGIEGDFINSCKDLGMNIFTYGPLAQGLLTGKYNDKSTFSNDDCRKRLPHFHGEKLKKHMGVIQKISEIADKYHITMSQVALRWVLENPNVLCAISGIKSVEQIEDNIEALSFVLHSDDNDFFGIPNEISKKI
jgi:aryl-alcohol dehydrogenase-like predicted oxidoreductase